MIPAKQRIVRENLTNKIGGRIEGTKNLLEGRHNAVDAIAGKMWLDNIDGTGKVFYTTGRLTSEMVIKVAQMGISILLSRSGLTQMGLKLARDLNVTMLARAKNKHFLIYNGHETIEFDVKLPEKLEVANLVKKLPVSGDL